MLENSLPRLLLLTVLLPACSGQAPRDDENGLLGRVEQRQIFDPDDPGGTPQLPKFPKGPITNPPMNVSAALLDGAMYVGFKCATNTSWYQLERSVDGGAYQEVASEGAPDGQDCLLIDPYPEPEAKNCYRVIASNADHSAKSTNTSCQLTPPAAPVLSAMVIAMAFGKRIDVTISESTELDQSVVLERRTTYTQFVQVSTWPAGGSVDRVYEDTDVFAGTEYTYRARIKSAAGYSRWGAVVAHTPSSAPPSPPGQSCPAGGCDGGSTGSSGSTGSGKAGVDCGCTKTGSYAPPVPPTVLAGNKSPDGKYQGTLENKYLSIKRLADNKKVFGSPVLFEAKWGFGPDSRYLVLAEHQNAQETGGITLTVHDLEKDQRLYINSLPSGGGWGFSPDGRGFMVSFKSPNGQFGYNLLNLDKKDDATLFFQPPVPAANLFSPCGDLFALVRSTGSVTENTQSMNFYSIKDLKSKPAISIKSWNGFIATPMQHEAKRVNLSNLKLFANDAALSCGP